MDKLKKGFNKWLNKTIAPYKRFIMKGYCFVIYENNNTGYKYSVEFTMFDKYDENDVDWNCGGCEYYASRFDNNEYHFTLEGDFEVCLDTVGRWISDYLEKGKYRKLLKEAEIIAYCFPDSENMIAYKKSEAEQNA